jgi:hypothetical protein
MSDILIKGMEMPKEGSWKTVRIYPDGTCAVPNWQGDCTFIKGAKAVPVPEHGRLIDADALVNKHFGKEYLSKIMTADEDDMGTALVNIPLVINNAPTIIPAEEGE